MTSPADDAYSRQDWRVAFETYSTAGALDAAGSERLAVAAYLIGENDACERAWEGAHRASLDTGDTANAARCACWLALFLLLHGQMAKASGWLARADRLIEGAGECAASGYRLVPAVLEALDSGDPLGALELSRRTTELGVRFGDADLRALATLGEGQALIAMSDHAAGSARLDEVMLSVVAGEVGPVTTGLVYCAVILECMALFDLARASEWTAALGAWCDAQPALVPYRGQCLVHRSQLQQAAGDWATAITTAEDACRLLTDPPHPALGLAHYQQAELHRLVGDLDAAEAAYRRASRLGHHPMPGLALLQLGRGDAAGAATAVRRALDEARAPIDRAPILAAAVEILRAAGDVAAARAAADELSSLASTPLLAAMAAYARGTVLVAEGDAVAALTELRGAARTWQSLHIPYEVARTAVALGLACAALGDRTTAALEFGNARATFAELGAKPDLNRVTAFLGGGGDVLSEREREVLGHLAAGWTNREIAKALVISPHTVRRHVENVFTKLGVTTRAAATAYAYEHQLLAQR